MKKILYISHEATRTGAPILLLTLLKWFKKNYPKIKITVLLAKGGPLTNEFKDIATTLVYESNLKGIKYKWHRFNLKRKIFNKKWDLVFSNTIVNGEQLKQFNGNIPIISYIHELEQSIQTFIDVGKAQGTLEKSNFFLCGSEMVQNDLIEKFNIDKSKTKVVRSFINFNELKVNEEKGLKAKLNIKKDDIIVGMIGSFIPRKGPDLFIQTAEKLKNKSVHFLWIGGDNSTYQNEVAEHYTGNKLTILPASADYFKYFDIMDVFFLASREDPYPLVMVEATSHGIPIICFKGAGGSQEFIDSQTGVTVPFEDIETAGKAILNLSNLVVKKSDADYIMDKSKKFHSVEVNAKMIVAILNKLISKNNV